MPNAITLAKQYIPLLDEVYKLASLTSILDGAPELARQGANAEEMIVPKISMDGLANYSRNSGYVSGDVTLTWETVKCNFDRGRIFAVDAMDNQESAFQAFGRLAGEFIRTKVVPEIDAFRLATYAQISGISTVDAAALTSGAALISALSAAKGTMLEDEVDLSSCYLYITPTLKLLVDDLDTTKSKKAMEGFAGVIQIPQSRFYTKITQKDGTTSGQTAGGYAKDSTNGKDINFMIIDKKALIQFPKHVAPKVITPEQNQSGDAWKFGYRNYGIADVYENKVAGIYLHKSTT